MWDDAVSHRVSFESFLVFLLGRNRLRRTAREELRHCRGEMLSYTGGMNLQNSLPRSVFKANSLAGVKGG